MKQNICYLLILILLTPAVASGAGAVDDGAVIDKIAAVVDDKIILLSELEAEMNIVSSRLKQEDIPIPSDDIFRGQVLENLVLRELQLSRAEERGIRVDDITVNEALKNLAENNKVSLSGFRNQLIAEGIDYEEFRGDLRKDLLIRRLRQKEVYNRIVISQRETEDFLEAQKSKNSNIKYLLSHIQVSLPEAADAETIAAAEERARKIYKRLQAEEDFSKIAVAESDGHSALEGGSLGWLTLSEVPSLFVDDVQKLEIGEHSLPIRAPRGFHIIKLRETKGIERHFVDQVNARHILIETNTLKTDKQVRKELNDIKQQIANGADFGELAKKLSADIASGANGGEMGWSEPGVYVAPFQKVVRTLPLNKVSEPFKTRFGWHIVEVLGRRKHDKTNEMELDEAFRSIHKRKAHIEEELWLRRMRDEAYVELRL